MALPIDITTTGLVSPVILNDLGDRTFIHPITYDLTQEYTLEEVRKSTSIVTNLNAGNITITYNAVVITTSSQLDNLIQIHTHDAADVTTGVFNINRGGTNSNTYTNSELIRMNAGGTAFESVGFTASNIVRNNISNTFGNFDQIFKSSRFIIRNLTDTFSYVFETSNITANRNLILPTLTSDDVFVFQDFSQTLKNKQIDVASGNNILNVADANIATHTSTKISITNKLQLNSAIIYNDQNNTFGNFDQIFLNTRLNIRNIANTFSYKFNTSAITVDRNVTLPLLITDDTFVFESHTQTLTNKTLNTTNNNLISTGANLGALLKYNGTKYVNFNRLTGFNDDSKVLNNGGSDINWVYPYAIGDFGNINGTATTTSTTFVNLTMGADIFVQAAGTYLVFMSGMVAHSANGGGVEIQILLNGTPISGSVRTWKNQNTLERSMLGHTGFRVNAPVNNTITIQWRATSAGTASIQNPTLSAILYKLLPVIP
jgi:hypothetical protein